MDLLQKVKQDEEVKALIEASGAVLKSMNYTEHGLRHANYVSRTAGKILFELRYDKREVELATVAGYMHDIGNSINRTHHGQTSALLTYDILKRLNVPFSDISKVTSAIGNHEEQSGFIVNSVTAALVIADKSDAHRTRVTRETYDPNDIHDRVNFSIKKSYVSIDREKSAINSKIYMDNSSSVMEYLKIYIDRIVMSEKAAHFLNCSFNLYINDVLINSPKHIGATQMKKILEEVEE